MFRNYACMRKTLRSPTENNMLLTAQDKNWYILDVW